MTSILGQKETMTLNELEIPYETLVRQNNLKVIQRRSRTHPLSDDVYVICHRSSNRMIGKPFKTLQDAYAAFTALMTILNDRKITLESEYKSDHPHAVILKAWLEQCYLDGYLTKE